MSPSPPPCCHPGGFQHSLPCPCSPDQQVLQQGELAVGWVLHCKARHRGSVGRRAWWHWDAWAVHPGTLWVPPEASTAPCHLPWPGTHPGKDTPWLLLPAPAGPGCEGLCSPSMMPHLVLRPSTRLPFTWCSWSAPTTAKGIFSCQQRLCSPRVLSPGVPRVPVPTLPPRMAPPSQHPGTHTNPVVQSPVLGVLVKVLLWVHADGVGLQVLLDLGDTGLEPGLGGTRGSPGAPWGPVLTLCLNSARSSRVSVSALAITGTTLTILLSRRMNSRSSGRSLARASVTPGCPHLCHCGVTPPLPRQGHSEVSPALSA